ncbi:MAG: hypothetical protein R3B82_15495 [Sandaracinaceae bacterium]
MAWLLGQDEVVPGELARRVASGVRAALTLGARLPRGDEPLARGAGRGSVRVAGCTSHVDLRVPPRRLTAREADLDADGHRSPVVARIEVHDGELAHAPVDGHVADR